MRSHRVFYLSFYSHLFCYCRFGYQQSRTSALYSSDVLSCSIANLPIQLKYKAFLAFYLALLMYGSLFRRCLTRNLLILCIFPGPKAPDWKQTQQLLIYVVDELIRLFYEGIRIKTSLYPEGKLTYLLALQIRNLKK